MHRKTDRATAQSLLTAHLKAIRTATSTARVVAIAQLRPVQQGRDLEGGR